MSSDTPDNNSGGEWIEYYDVEPEYCENNPFADGCYDNLFTYFYEHLIIEEVEEDPET